MKPTLSIQRKPPTHRIFRPDQLETFKKNDSIDNFSDINESWLKFIGLDYIFVKNVAYALFYKIQKHYSSAPEITEWILINSNLHVKLIFKGSPIALTAWFRKGRNT